MLLFFVHVVLLKGTICATLDGFSKNVKREGKMKPETHQVLMDAMDSVVNHIGGTGKRGTVKNIRVGGKTGSGEWKKGEKTHAWFASVAPLDDPKIAVAVIMEASGGGGMMAAPVAQKIMEEFFYGDSLKREEQ